MKSDESIIGTPNGVMSAMKVRRVAHQRVQGCPGCKEIETGRSMPHNNKCRTRIRSIMEQSGLKKEVQRQDRSLEKAVMRSVNDDSELRRAEDEDKRKLVEVGGRKTSVEEESGRPIRSRSGP